MWAMASSLLRFAERTIFGKTSLNESSARRRDLYLTTRNTHSIQISMFPGGIRNHNLSRRMAANPFLRPRGHWDQHTYTNENINTVELQLSGLIGTVKHPDLQKIRIIGFFFVNRLHWQIEVRLLLFTICTCV